MTRTLLLAAMLALSMLACSPSGGGVSDGGRDVSASPQDARGESAASDARNDTADARVSPADGADAGAPPLPVATAALAALFTTDAGPQATLYASPVGAGTACSIAAPCPLPVAQQAAQALAPSMTSDVLVYLRGGTYALTSPWAFTGSDSGQQGHRVLYAGFPGETALVSGGAPVPASAWHVVDAGSPHVEAALPGASFRDLYVGGSRATRAATPTLPAGFAAADGGYTTTDPSVASWPHPTSVELVAFSHWQMYRCPVAALAAANGGTFVELSPACWGTATAEATGSSGAAGASPQWLENSAALLGAPGSFTFDATSATLSYVPRPGEDLATSPAVYPILPTLVTITGTAAAPVHDLVLFGLSFAHTSWMQASSTQGYVGVQAGLDNRTGLPPAAVDVERGERVMLVSDQLRHLGGMGIRLGTGAVDDSILGCDLEDIASVAIEIGNLGGLDAHPTDTTAIVSGNLVRDNFINASGVEYLDAVGILAGYTEHTTIDHNELFGLPYTAISVGWGWGSVDPGAASSNATVTQNHIAYAMRRLFDGGGIYTLGEQPASLIQGNYVHGIGALFGALYLDNGTQGYTVSGNAVCDDPSWLYVQVGAPTATNDDVTGNFTCDNNGYLLSQVAASDVVSGNLVADAGLLASPAAAAVIAGAGLEPAYAWMHPPNRAASRPATASSVWAGDPVAYAAPMANDETATSGWSPASTDTSPWWQVDLGKAYAITRVEVLARMDYDQPVTRQNFAVEGSNDATFATFDTLGEQGALPFADRGVYFVEVPGTKAYRYVRLAKTASEYFFLAEVRVLAL